MFGLQVERTEKSFSYFLLTNQSKFDMDVSFELTGNVNLLQHLKAEHQNAVIDVGNHLQTSLMFSPKGICDLQDVSLRIKVRRAEGFRFTFIGSFLGIFSPRQVKLGPTYSFAIKGKSSPPSLEFSFVRHNFGKCLLHQPGMVPASTTLVIRNTGVKDVG